MKRNPLKEPSPKIKSLALGATRTTGRTWKCCRGFGLCCRGELPKDQRQSNPFRKGWVTKSVLMAVCPFLSEDLHGALMVSRVIFHSGENWEAWSVCRKIFHSVENWEEWSICLKVFHSVEN